MFKSKKKSPWGKKSKIVQAQTNSFGYTHVTIPKSLMEELEWPDNPALQPEVIDGKLVYSRVGGR